MDVVPGPAPPTLTAAEGAGGPAALSEHVEPFADHRLPQFVLASDVGIEGHGADAEAVGDSAHGDGLKAVASQQVEGGADHDLASLLVVGLAPACLKPFA